MKALILGGCRSGKSDFAQELALELAGKGKRYYIATMRPSCPEDHSRIASHLQRRAGMGFETIEQPDHLLGILDAVDCGAVFLLDSVTTLLTNEFYPPEEGYAESPTGAARCREELLVFLQKVDNAVLVADNLFCDAVRYEGSTDAFRRHLGRICCDLAAACDRVYELSAGCLKIHKGENL